MPVSRQEQIWAEMPCYCAREHTVYGKLIHHHGRNNGQSWLVQETTSGSCLKWHIGRGHLIHFHCCFSSSQSGKERREWTRRGTVDKRRLRDNSLTAQSLYFCKVAANSTWSIPLMDILEEMTEQAAMHTPRPNHGHWSGQNWARGMRNRQRGCVGVDPAAMMYAGSQLLHQKPPWCLSLLRHVPATERVPVRGEPSQRGRHREWKRI